MKHLLIALLVFVVGTMAAVGTNALRGDSLPWIYVVEGTLDDEKVLEEHSADLEAMMAVWSNDENIVCIHPQGPRLTGTAEVRDSWRQILSNSPPMTLRIDGLNTIHDEDLAIRFVNEHIHVGSGTQPEFTILATNVFRRTDEGWRLVLHHASPTPEAIRNIIDDSDDEGGSDVTVH